MSPAVLMTLQVSIVDGALVIGAVSKAHEAEYTCTASNAAGTDSLRTIIYVSEAQNPTPSDRRDERRDERRDDRRNERRQPAESPTQGEGALQIHHRS